MDVPLPALLVVALATAGAGPCDDAGGAPVCTVERNVVLTRTDHWPVPQDVPPLSNDLLLLTNTGEDTISMVRASAMTELFRAPLIRAPKWPSPASRMKPTAAT